MSVGNPRVKPGAAAPAAAPSAAAGDGGSEHGRQKFWMLVVGGFLPGALFFVSLDKAAQWASIIALTCGFWAAAVGYLPRVRLPWRPLAGGAAAVLVLLGGGVLVNALYQARRDIEMPGLSFDGMSTEDVWGQRTTGVLTIAPPYRGHVRLTFVLRNTRPQAGDCVYPAVLTLTPVIDGLARPDATRTTHSGRAVDVPLDGPESRAQVQLLLSYPDDGPVTCRVRVTITRTVLHG